MTQIWVYAVSYISVPQTRNGSWGVGLAEVASSGPIKNMQTIHKFVDQMQDTKNLKIIPINFFLLHQRDPIEDDLSWLVESSDDEDEDRWTITLDEILDEINRTDTREE